LQKGRHVELCIFQISLSDVSILHRPLL
jgi:hypothetical protein